MFLLFLFALKDPDHEGHFYKEDNMKKGKKKNYKIESVILLFNSSIIKFRSLYFRTIFFMYQIDIMVKC